MGILGGASGVKSSKPPVYTCLQIQTSAQGLPIPLFWGAQRLSGNCIDYFNFQGSSSKKGSGGKGGKSGTEDYTAAVAIALCEGAGQGFTVTMGRVWSGISETTLEGFGGGFFNGVATQEPWASAAAIGHDDSYAYTAYYANYSIDLGSSASLPNLNFELFSTFNGYHVDNANTHLPDANFGDIIPDFLTNQRYGVGLPPGMLSGFNEGGLEGTSSLLVYNLAAGIFVSPLLKDAEQVTSILQRWANVGNFWIFYSGTTVKCVCLGDAPISAHGVNYVPDVTPIYDLGPDDFMVVEKGAGNAPPPVKVTRKDPADMFNQVQLNASIRTTNGGVANSPAYQDTPFRWQDSSSIDLVGPRAPNTISSTEICNVGTAAVVVSLIGQRTLYIRNTYSFKLLDTFLLLEPGDIVTLTDPNIGLAAFPVRITMVSEDDKGNLDFTAEEFAYGVGQANVQEFEPSGSQNPFNQLEPPGSVNTPAFLVPSLSLTGGQAEIWIAASAGANVGGCGVFVSFDDLTFTQIGEITTPSIQGTLTASLPLVAGLDESSTLAIDLTECLGVIPATATEADAQAGRTLCMIDEELLAYGNVTPSGSYTANLTYLERGLYGTTPAAHAAGAPFARIDQTKVFQYALPEQYAGTELYFQFPTVNQFGNLPQSLSDCVTYTFTPAAYTVPILTMAADQYNGDGSYAGLLLEWPAPAGQPPTGYTLRWSNSDGAPGAQEGYASAPAGATQILIPAATVLANPGGYGFAAIQATYGNSASAWSAPKQVTGATNLPNLLSGLTATPGAGSAALAWSAASGPAPTFYRAFAWQGTPGVAGYTITHVDVAAPATGTSITGLSAGSIYTFAVVPFSLAGTADTFAAGPSFQPVSSPEATATPT